jgi:hypothetical protein
MLIQCVAPRPKFPPEQSDRNFHSSSGSAQKLHNSTDCTGLGRGSGIHCDPWDDEGSEVDGEFGESGSAVDTGGFDGDAGIGGWGEGCGGEVWGET